MACGLETERDARTVWGYNQAAGPGVALLDHSRAGLSMEPSAAKGSDEQQEAARSSKMRLDLCSSLFLAVFRYALLLSAAL